MYDEGTTGTGHKTRVVAAKLTPPEYAMVKEAAAKELLPISIYIRRILLHPQNGGGGRAAA